MTDWLTNLKPGDKIILNSSYVGEHYRRIVIVTRTTDTMVVAEILRANGNPMEHRFSKRNGYEVGSSDSFNRTYITEATETIVAEVREENFRHNLIAYLNKIKWDSITTKTLKAVYDVLKPPPPESPADPKSKE